MKYLAIDFHYVRNKVQGGTIRVTHISEMINLRMLLQNPSMTSFSIIIFQDRTNSWTVHLAVTY